MKLVPVPATRVDYHNSVTNQWEVDADPKAEGPQHDRRRLNFDFNAADQIVAVTFPGGVQTTSAPKTGQANAQPNYGRDAAGNFPVVYYAKIVAA